jgi:hypothetical protein
MDKERDLGIGARAREREGVKCRGVPRADAFSCELFFVFLFFPLLLFVRRTFSAVNIEADGPFYE